MRKPYSEYLTKDNIPTQIAQKFPDSVGNPNLDKMKLSEIRKKPGESNAGKYKTKGPFAGPDKTFPINTSNRARSALSYAHNAANPEAIRKKVYSAFPSLAKNANEKK
jgi:hypothetical protein